MVIDAIRDKPDSKASKVKKMSLPLFCFSGKFSKRKKDCLIEHSGFMVVDLDGMNSVQKYKDKLKLIPYVKSVFISPRGAGLKVIAETEISPQADDAIHKEVFLEMIEDLKSKSNIPDKYFDMSGKDVSRACFTSYDPEIYIASSTSKFVKPKKKKVSYTDYEKVSVAANMIRLSGNKEKHNVLLKAAYLMGGYIASNVVNEDVAIQVLESEIQKKDIDSYKAAQTTIRKGIEQGKLAPITETQRVEREARVNQLKVQKFDEDRGYEFLSDKEKDREEIRKFIKGDIDWGLKTGHKKFDEHFRFKKGTTNIILGHANVGKSYFSWWLMTLAAVLHGWKWIVYSSENRASQIKRTIASFKAGKNVKDMNLGEATPHLDWVDEMFEFIRIDEFYSGTDLIDFSSALCSEVDFDGVLVDPYNSLSIDPDLWRNCGGNRHEYDYAIASKFNSLALHKELCILIGTHAVTEALRRKHRSGQYATMTDERYVGQPMPPDSPDIEGGGKFVNKVTGFFMVVHRYIFDEQDRGVTKVEIKKTKLEETGGKNTTMESPVEFKMGSGLASFYELTYREDPIKDFYKENQAKIELKTNHSPPISKENADIDTHPFGDDEDEDEIF